VVTTLAGLAGSAGSADGTGSAARFDQPKGVAVDSSGNVYVADSSTVFVTDFGTYSLGNNTIRKVTPSGVATTLAGLAGSYGSTDGIGSAARFNGAFGVAVDSGGNVYVADQGNNTIRKATAAGVVTTLAGQTGKDGSADGTGSAARFNMPLGVAVDMAGNTYVADTDNNTIRKITPGGVVTTLAGLAGSAGSADGTGSAARFNQPMCVAVDSAGNVYVADSGNNTIRKGWAASIGRTVLMAPVVLGDGSVELSLSGLAGLSCTIQVSTNLVDWLPLESLINTNGTVTVTDRGTTSFRSRFYRAVTP
jgi:hypothetical protein